MIEPRDDFAPFINAVIAGFAVWVASRAWKRLDGRGRTLQLLVSIGAGPAVAVGAGAIKSSISN